MTEEKTFSDILREKMSNTTLKGKDGKDVTPLEAMVMSVMNNAMKGDISAIQFISNLTSQEQWGTDPQWMKQQADRLAACQEQLREELETEGFTVEIGRLAQQMMILQRIEDLMQKPGHQDIESRTQRDGTNQMQLSATNRIYGDLLKQFRHDMKELRTDILRQKVNQQNTRRK